METLPAVYALQLADLVARWTVAREDLFAGLGVAEAELAAPGAALSIAAYERLIERARGLTGEPAIGLHLGLQTRISVHGDLGLAAMTATDVREALELAIRYLPTRTRALAFRLHEAPPLASLVIEERVPLGTARDVVLFAVIVGIWQIGTALTGRTLTGEIELAFDEPAYFARLRRAGVIPGSFRFGQPANRLVFDAAILDLPLVMADPAAQRVARERCELALAEVGRGRDLLDQVRALFPRAGGEFPTLEEVSRRLHTSTRTLKRRLGERDTSYAQLVDGARRELATLLLRDPDLSIEEVAARLGYSDAANFTRAFRRWTGTTPRAFRRHAGDRTLA